MSGTTAPATTAGLNLSKGEKLELTKTNPQIAEFCFGLGWDAPTGGTQSYDLDAFAILLNKDGKLIAGPELTKAVMFFNNPSLKGVSSSGDNRTGAGDGDDETISVLISELNQHPEVESVVICVNIFEADSKNQRFGAVKSSFVRGYDKANPTTELFRFDLQEDYSAYTGVVVGRVYKHNGEWKFEALGEGVSGNIEQIAQRYL